VTEDLERRLQHLEDIEAIKQLKTRYCAFCDDGYNADGIASLFTQNGVWDGEPRGVNHGREAIRDFFRRASSRVPFAVHNIMNPIINVQGEEAHGSWYLFQMATEENGAKWVSGRYEEDYVKIEERWYFKHLKVRFAFWTPFDKGWVKQPFG
jgi:hypothetical protein